MRYALVEGPPAKDAPNDMWIAYYRELMEVRDAGELLIGDAVNGGLKLDEAIRLTEERLRVLGLDNEIRVSSQ